MTIDWTAFGAVFVVSSGAAVGVMVLFAFATTMLAGPTRSGDGGPHDGATAGGTAGPAARAIAALCYLACAAVVGYGLYILVS